MKILWTDWYIEWLGREPQVLKPAVLPLDDQKVLFGLAVSVGNCEYDEVCIETDSMEAKECIAGLLCGTGNAKRIGPSSEVAQRRLSRWGYEIYLQGKNSHYFVNPAPRPELFAKNDLDSYLAEFKQA